MKTKAVIFDLDGTLIDSLEDIALCMNDVLAEFNLPTHPLHAYNHFVGDGALYLTQRAVPKDASPSLIEAIFKRYQEVYDTVLCENTKAYEGIYELLDTLQHHQLKIGVLSNKPHAFTLKYVQTLFSRYSISEVHGQKEQVPKKPHPLGAINIAQAFELHPSEIFYVGDTPTDILTAQNAQMKSIGVLWGFRPKKELEDAGADFLAHTPQDIWKIIHSQQ